MQYTYVRTRSILRNAGYVPETADFTKLNDKEAKTIARHEIKLNLEQIMKISRKLLKNKGCLAIVHRPERFMDIVIEMTKQK